MKIGKTLIALAAVGFLASACTTAEQTAVGGAAIGAGVAAATGSNIAAGALIGGAAGYVIGRTADGKTCRYQRPDGSTYVAACP